ncbi:hypothetical protein L1987_06230 [Smallanthus sonchifolius]|uniref:Uncharacterized protein n=1 Tax=Smallanthus sonchifolius TaxID=185202 RepID=A0ACB9JXJ7_9ASTR|nr:hypothetical protein L1987_06230 [Smallanthus sonchifolius]
MANQSVDVTMMEVGGPGLKKIEDRLTNFNLRRSIDKLEPRHPNPQILRSSVNHIPDPPSVILPNSSKRYDL